MGNGPGSPQRDGDHVVELHPRGSGNLEGMILNDTGIDIEITVATQSPGFVAGDRVRHLVGRVAVGAAIVYTTIPV